MPPIPRDGIRIVACLFLVLFLGVADNQILSPLLPTIRAQFGRSSSDMGYLFSGYSFCAGASVLVWGPLSDAFGRRRGLLQGLILFAIGSFVASLSTGFPMLLTGRIISGIGGSMLSLNSIAYTADYFPYESRGWAMGCVMSSYFAALIFGVPLGAVLGETYSWKAVFGVIGVSALVLLILCYHMLPKTGSGVVESSKKPVGEYVNQYLGFLRSQSSLAGLLCAFFASAGIMGFLAFIGSWLHDAFGITTGRIGLVFLASGAAAVLASPMAGFIADRIGKRLQFVCSSICLAIFLFILPHVSWGVVLFVVIGVISLSAAFRQGPMEAVLTEITHAATRGTFIALKNSFSQLGIGAATLFSGMLFDASGYKAVCILSAALSLMAAVSMMFTYRERNL